MSVDENTRLRIRQYLADLMDESAADAMMESMPPIPWTQLATKDDIAQLDRRLGGVDGRLGGVEGRLGGVEGRLGGVEGRLDGVDGRLDGVDGRLDRVDGRLGGVEGRLDVLTLRVDQTSSDLQELTRVVAMQGASLGSRMDSVGERVDGLASQIGELSRALAFGTLTVAITLAVFIVGTIASLIAAGAFA